MSSNYTIIVTHYIFPLHALLTILIPPPILFQENQEIRMRQMGLRELKKAKTRKVLGDTALRCFSRGAMKTSPSPRLPSCRKFL